MVEILDKLITMATKNKNKRSLEYGYDMYNPAPFIENNPSFKYYADNINPIYVDNNTGEVWQNNKPKGAIVLPEVEVKGRHLKATEAGRNMRQEKGLENPMIDPFLGAVGLSRGVGNMMYMLFPTTPVEDIVYTPITTAAMKIVSPAIKPIGETVRRSLVEPYKISHLPGYQLKSLMRGNPLEKQLSKQGTINVDGIRNQFGKASSVEKAVIDKVLSLDKFSGKKAIDYNDFRKSVQDELIDYKRVPSIEYEDYGMDRLGFREDKHVWDMPNDPAYDVLDDGTIVHAGTNIPVTQIERKQWLQQNMPSMHTFTFESPRIGLGNDAHYNIGTLGHSRTYVTKDEPDILHVLESQSDWGQHKMGKARFIYNVTDGNTNIAVDKNGNYYTTDIGKGIPYNEFVNLKEKGKMPFELAKQQFLDNYPEAQAKYLHDNYLQRQLQENLRFAAERGQKKMRYPTSDTAAKIEGYQKNFSHSDETERLSKEIHDTQAEFEEAIRLQDDPFILSPAKQHVDNLEKKLKDLRVKFNDALAKAPKDYYPEHKTILKKYSDFPKQYKKLFKDDDVRTIIDKKGNSWYEIDVPEDYLNREWKFKNGGSIHIAPSKRGTFTAAATKHGMGVQEFASRVLRNKEDYSSAMVKKANFARNTSKWNN